MEPHDLRSPGWPVSHSQGRHGDPDARPTPGTTIGWNHIVLLNPPDLPESVRRDTGTLSDLLRRIIPPTPSTASAMQEAALQVLANMGAAPEHIERVAAGLPHELLCKLFCGKDAPILIGHGGDCEVDFAILHPVDPDDLILVAESLARRNMPVQGALLLVALSTTLGEDSQQARVLEALAKVLQRHADVPLAGTCLFRLRCIVWKLHAERKVSATCFDVLQAHKPCLAQWATSRQRAIQVLELRRGKIDQGLKCIPGKVMERCKALAPIVEQLVSLHHDAFAAEVEDPLNFAIDTLEHLGHRYADANALRALKTCEAHRTLAERRQEAAQVLEHIRMADIQKAGGSQLPEALLEFDKLHDTRIIRIEQKHNSKENDPKQLLNFLRASTHPGAIAAYLEHARELGQPVAPADVRDLWIRHARSNPENIVEAIQGWMKVLDKLSLEDLVAFIQVCSSAKLPAGLLHDAMQIVMDSPQARGLPAPEQAAVLACLLKLDGQALMKLAPRFEFMFNAAPEADGRNPLAGMLLAIAQACAAEGMSFDDTLVEMAVQCDSQVGQPLLVPALVLRLMRLAPSDRQLSELAGVLEHLAFASRPDGSCGSLWMMDVFVALAEAEEGPQVLGRLLPALLERTKLEALVIIRPQPRDAAYRLLATFLVARGMASGDLAGALDQLEQRPICGVYFLLVLCDSARRRGQSEAANDFLLEAVGRFLDPPGLREGGWEAWYQAARGARPNAEAKAIINACNKHSHGTGYRTDDFLFEPDGLLLEELCRMRALLEHHGLAWMENMHRELWKTRI